LATLNMRGMTIRSRRVRNDRRGERHVEPSVIDFPWDPAPDAQGLWSEVTCEIPWRADGFEAIQVYVDPGLRDQADGICRAMEGLARAHRGIDALADACMEYASREDLEVAIHEQLPDDRSTGVIVVAVTTG
jgi:hypothetical protein